MVPIEKQLGARKCEDFNTISLISHARNVAWKAVWEVERLNGSEQFCFLNGKGTRDTTGVLRTIGERYLEKNMLVFVDFIGFGKII